MLVAASLLGCGSAKANTSTPCVVTGMVGVPFSPNLAVDCANNSSITSCPFGPGVIPFAPGINSLGGCTIYGTPTQAGLFVGNVFDIGGTEYAVNILILQAYVTVAVKANGPYMTAQFTAPPIMDHVDPQDIPNPTLQQLATAAGFASFDWQQQITVFPWMSTLQPVPNNPSAPGVSNNIFPTDCDSSVDSNGIVVMAKWNANLCSMVAGGQTATDNIYAPFYDPPPGSYVYITQIDPDYNPYPFYYPSSNFSNFFNSGMTQLYCTVPNYCPDPFPLEFNTNGPINGTILSMVDAPSNTALPGITPSPEPSAGTYMAFSSSLVGVSDQAIGESESCDPNNPGVARYCTTLYSWTWNSTYNGRAIGMGGVTINQTATIYPVDPNSGTGGATVTSKRGIPTPTMYMIPSEQNTTTEEALTVTVVVDGGSGNPTPTGSVTLTGGNYTSTATSLFGNFALITVPAGSLPSGTDTLTAVYIPDATSVSTYSDASASATVSVTTQGATAPTVTVTPSSSTITIAQAFSVTVVVSGGSGSPTPTGSVILTSGSYTSPVKTLSGGSASIAISAGLLELGADTLTAIYTPDASSSPTYNAASGSAPVTVTAPAASLSPTSLRFAPHQVGTASDSQPVTLTNTGTAPLSVSSVAASTDFSQSNNCGSSVAASGSCTINVSFSPTATGTLTGTLTVTDNSNGAEGSTQTVSLTGTGIAAIASATTTTLAVTSGVDAVTTVTSGSVVTLTATVMAGGTPVTPGQVNFCDATANHCTDIHVMGTAQLTSAGTALLKFVPGIGGHSYKAVFLGTAGDVASSSSASALTVTGKVATNTALAQSGLAGDYALAATVTGSAGKEGLPSLGGTVSFLDTSNGNTVLGTAALVPGASGAGWFNSQSPAVSSNPFAVAVGDFNGDGKADLAVATYYETVTILLGNGDGTFTPANVSPATGAFSDFIVVGDFNGDGKADLAAASADNNAVTILLGNGDGTFTAAPSPATGPHAKFIGGGGLQRGRHCRSGCGEPWQ